jgi:hypothetical protein
MIPGFKARLKEEVTKLLGERKEFEILKSMHLRVNEFRY